MADGSLEAILAREAGRKSVPSSLVLNESGYSMP